MLTDLPEKQLKKQKNRRKKEEEQKSIFQSVMIPFRNVRMIPSFSQALRMSLRSSLMARTQSKTGWNRTLPEGKQLLGLV